jgi:hypothetical protein
MWRNLSENYLEFGNVPTKMFASLVLGKKKFKKYQSEGWQIITLAKASNYQPAKAPTGLGPSLHAENDSNKIFNIVGKGSDPSNRQNDKIQK